ncbi:MAG: MBL fold metallo-hydrolase [Candidatus Micrarchaeota archaeon]
MAFHLECFGASREVGRSAFLLQTDKRIMLDYGIKIFDPSGQAQYPANDITPDFAVISHAHLDHSGFVPAFYRNSKIRWYATPPTRDFCEVLWKDSMKIMGPDLPYTVGHYKKALKYWAPMLYGRPVHTGETRIKLHDAGHIAGAAIVDIEYKGKRVCYTGDFKMEATQMHEGAKKVKDVDTLIIESTYAQRDHPPRRELEQKFVEEMRETLDSGGNFLLPAFSLGRTQELISLIRKYDRNIPVFVDGMGRELTRLYLKNPQYIRDAKRFRKDVQTVTLVKDLRDRRMATQSPSVIVSSAGMMSGGPVLGYLFNVNQKSKVVFTGYCMQDTNGWLLQNEGHIIKNDQELSVDLPVEYLDFSAHAGRKELIQFIKAANPERVILVHGDSPEIFAQELREGYGIDANAPVLGERIEL